MIHKRGPNKHAKIYNRQSLTWFSCLLRHPARKRSVYSYKPGARMGYMAPTMAEQCTMVV